MSGSGGLHRHPDEHQTIRQQPIHRDWSQQTTATCLLLFGVIPIQQNRRFVRAQTAAIKAKAVTP
jgi:hypothetical protein